MSELEGQHGTYALGYAGYTVLDYDVLEQYPVATGTTAVQLVRKNPNRVKLVIRAYPTNTEPVYLYHDANVAATRYHTVIPTGETVTIDHTDKRAVWAYAAATTAVDVWEYIDKGGVPAQWTRPASTPRPM